MKKMHPDANRDTKKTNILDTSTTAFTAVTEAYSTLSNPKLRLRYDRSLQAAKLTHLFGKHIDEGIKTVAIPLMKRTADTAEDVGSKVGRAGARWKETQEDMVEDVGVRVGLARERFKVEVQIRELEQKAAKEETRASTLRTQINEIRTKRLPILTTQSQQQKPDEFLTSTTSTQILDSFLSLDERIDNDNDIDPKKIRPSDLVLTSDILTLTDCESDYDTSIANTQRSTTDVQPPNVR